MKPPRFRNVFLISPLGRNDKKGIQSKLQKDNWVERQKGNSVEITKREFS